MADRLSKLIFECTDLASEADHIDSSPEGYRLTRKLDMAILTEATLLCKIVGWQSTVVEKRQSVRICETEPELTVSETDRWVELTTNREFFDYAIPLAVEHKRKHQERLAILHAHPRE